MRGTLRAGIARSITLGATIGGAASAGLVLAALTLAGVSLEPLWWAAVPLAALGCALAAWPLATLSARRQTASVERLAATASSFAAGNRTARARVGGPREVRLIADSFNRMADDVETAFEALGDEEARKTQFVSDVSHELRTPLTAIRGAAETLLDGDVGLEDQERFLSTIAREAERLTRLANDLLALQRIEGATGELPLRRVNLRDAADRAAQLLEPLMEDRGVTLSVTGRAPLVLGDLDRLQQVVANLVDNASRIVGAGGHVDVALATADDGSAVLAVSDDGPGIPEDDLPRLFDRFYRADSSRTRSRGGAGLGLAIVKAIVTSHAGTIEATNLEPHGSRFTVRLPALPAE